MMVVLQLAALVSILSRTNGLFPIIKGNENFCRQVKDALTLLEQKYPAGLDFINDYVKVIQIYNTSGMCVTCQPPTFQLFPKPDNMEKYWLAGSIAHDSYHSYLYQLNKFIGRGAEPSYESYSGFEAERQCNRFQLQVLIAIGAPSSQTDWMLKQDGRHCDANKDGKCDGDDYVIRQTEVKSTGNLTKGRTWDKNTILAAIDAIAALLRRHYY